MAKTKEQISYNMSRVKNKNSKIEMLLRKELWNRGLRYQKNVKTIMGKPDIVFKGKKIAVFCDSEFWHCLFRLFHIEHVKKTVENH